MATRILEGLLFIALAVVYPIFWCIDQVRRFRCWRAAAAVGLCIAAASPVHAEADYLGGPALRTEEGGVNLCWPFSLDFTDSAFDLTCSGGKATIALNANVTQLGSTLTSDELPATTVFSDTDKTLTGTLTFTDTSPGIVVGSGSGAVNWLQKWDGTGTDPTLGIDNTISQSILTASGAFAIKAPGANLATLYFYNSGAAQQGYIHFPSSGGDANYWTAWSFNNGYYFLSTSTSTGPILKLRNNYSAATNIDHRVTSATCSSGATCTWSNGIPAASIVLGVTARVTTTVTGTCGSLDIGDGTTANLFANDIALTSGTTTTLANHLAASLPAQYTAANNVVITCNGGTFSGGVLRLTAHFITLDGPAS